MDGISSPQALSAYPGEKLKDARQWRSWSKTLRKLALNSHVWDLCDPDTEKGDEADLTEPEAPEPPDEDDIGDAEASRAWRDKMEWFRWKHSRWNRTDRGLQLVYEWIIANLDPIHKEAVVGLDRVSQMIRYLRQHVGQTTIYEEDLRLRWIKECTTGPKKGSDVLKWVDQWDRLRNEAASYDFGIKDADYACRNFIACIPEVLPIWWQAQYTKVVINKENAQISLLLDDFRASYRATAKKPAESASKGAFSAFSTWQGHEESKPDSKSKPFEERTCPCGLLRHKPWNCWQLNTEARPDDYQVNPSKESAAKKELNKDPAFKSWVQQKIKEHNASEAGRKKKTESAQSALKQPEIGAYSGFHTSLNNAQLDESIRNQWILDSGASAHICNERSLFRTFKEDLTSIRTGDGKTPVYGRGTAVIEAITPSGKPMQVTLSDTLYSPGFHCNLVSVYKLEARGGSWDMQNGCILDPDRRQLMAVDRDDKQGLYVFALARDGAPATEHAALYSSKTPLSANGSLETWHRRLGHTNREAIQKLPDMVDGIRISDDNPRKPSEMCETCHLIDAPRQISRRPISQHFGRCGRVYFDLINMQMAYNKHSWITHFYVEGIRFHWAMSHVSRNGCQQAVRLFIAFADRWLGLPLKVFHSDNETAIDISTDKMMAMEGFIRTFTVPGHPEMNGPAERSGGALVKRARALLHEGNLPYSLWPEAIASAAYIMNRTPTRIGSEWKLPLEEARQFAHGVRPPLNLANIKLYGSLAYCRIQGIPQTEKMHPRAEIGFLVGYVASNVWKIWFPWAASEGQRVRFVRDAIFNESRKYSPGMKPYQPVEEPIEQEPEILPMENHNLFIHQGLTEILNQNDGSLNQNHGDQGMHREDDDRDAERQYHARILSERRTETPEAGDAAPQEIDKPLPSYWPSPQTYRPAAADQGVEGVHDAADHRDLTPADTETTEILEPAPSEREQEDQQISEQLLQSLDHVPTSITTPLTNVDESNILSGQRTRRARRDDDYAYLTTEIADDDGDAPPAYLNAFAAGLYAPRPETHHRDDLPPPPKNHREVMKHLYRDGFFEAMERETEGLKAKGTFDVVDRPKDRGTQVLPLIWVYTYKFDADGFLTKCKARICARGDLQMISNEEKRAATLAVRTARMMFALVAMYDLELKQLDVVNAFLNSDLDDDVYTALPEGFGRNGKVWKLSKALYGLRISPRLWHREASKVLIALGLKQLPEEPCIFLGTGVIVFFYVDDIQMAYRSQAAAEAERLETEMKKHWALTNHGEAEWFLGIRIIRNRKTKKLWLCQDSYIAGVAARFNLTERARVATPMTAEELKPYEGIASAAEIQVYQQKIGSLGYPTVITRPDAAKAHSVLSQYLTNPGPAHHYAADRLIVYLNSTRHLAIWFGAGAIPSVVMATDASYGDHRDRKSSAGYVCQIAGGPVDWRAAKQKTVTTSTTEAELLALSDTGKSLQWWGRVFRSIQFIPSQPVSIRCDNMRTVQLITKEDVAFDTKLRHVDIHGHWLRQEVKAGRIRIEWIPTADMVADGLTKILPRQKHERFIKLLGMEDISSLIG